jgi:choline-sulfatase
VAACAAWYVWRAGVRPRFVTTPDQNILIVTIDTLRADALGSYGGRARTPNLDRLAAAGIRFSFAHAHAVVTLPSHASILTGRYPYEHGVRDNAGFRLGEEAVTVAEMARAAGMATGAFVGAFPVDRQFGLAQGFEVYDDLGGRNVAPSDFAFVERPAAEVVAQAGAWIGAQQRPWLAWVHVFDPHSPYAPPPPYAQEYARQPYDGEVAYTDAALGPLLDLAARASRPTTIVVTADHGEGLGDHGEPTHGIFAYESTLRVPLILAQVGPGAPRRGGSVIDTPVRHVDIVPTLVELARLAPPAALSGRSLLTAGRDGSDRPSYFEAMTAMLKRGWAPLTGIVAGRQKYIDLPIDELYDLAADPGETTNLAGTAGELARTLASQLRQFGSALPHEGVAERAEVRERLQSLGYLSGSAPRKAAYTEEDDPKRLIDVDRLMIQGIELHRLGRAAEAAAAYRSVIARRPDMDLAYRRLAYIQWEAGHRREAIATLEQTLDRNGPSLESEIRLGTYLAETGAVAEAIALLERVTRAAPDHTDAWNALGIAYAGAGRGREALAAFRRILALDDRNALAHENIGTVHLQQGDTEAAAEAFARATSIDPRSSRARAGLGVVAKKTGRPSDAIDHWKQAVDLDPRNFDAVYNAATELAAAGRLDEARRYAAHFVRYAPRGVYAREIETLRPLAGL